MEIFTASAIAEIAFTTIFNTSFKKLTESAIEKINKLREKIWHKLKGNSNAQKAFEETEKGSQESLKLLEGYLTQAMETDSEFAKDIQQLAQEIINIEGVKGEVWNVSGGNVNYVKENQAPVIQDGGSNNTFNFNTYHNKD